MDNRILAPLAALALSGSPIFCGEVSPVSPLPESPFSQYHNRIAVFGPFHQVYERIKNHALYAGVELWILPVVALNQNKHKFIKHKDDECMGEVEFRMGYNLFYNGRDLLTPFGGVGVFRDFTHYSEHGKTSYKYRLLPAVGYGTLSIPTNTKQIL